MNKLTFSALLLLAVFSSCKKVVNAVRDKEVTLNFKLNVFTTSQATFETLPEYTRLIDFDKRDYPGIDSIIFAAGMGVSQAGDTSYVRLFNVTDGVEIANSDLISSKVIPPTGFTLEQTKNIYHSLPDKRINLAIQIRANGQTNEHFAHITEPYLQLRRSTH